MKNLLYIVFFSIGVMLLLPFCKSKNQISRLTSIDQLDQYRQDVVFDRELSCSDVLSYIPDDNSFQKQVRINVHFMNSEDSLYGFNEEKGKWYMKFLVHNANKRLRKNHKMNLPVGNTTPNLSPKYQYLLSNASEGDEGYHWHYDDNLCYFVNKGRNRNNYDSKVIDKYAIGSDSIVNIFVMPHHKDSLKGKTYKAFGTGIALNGGLKLAGLVEQKEKPWNYATLLNHEMGHMFGLRHSWAYNDMCDDTPKNPNCWQENKNKKGCEGPISNNVMDYNNSQMAITPCQLGIVHKSLSTMNSKYRNCVVPQWCKPDSSSIIEITEDKHWYGERDAHADIHILSGNTLTVHCRLSIPPNGEIVIHPGGLLRINEDARLHNDCNQKWSGIRLMNDNYKGDQLIISQTASIEDIN